MKRLIACLSLCAAAAIPLSSAHAAEPVRIGMGFPFTGAYAAPATDPLQAFRLWVDQVNDKGGLEVEGERRPIELVTYDDQSDPAKTVAVYEKLITDDKVDLLLSPWGAPSHFAVVGTLERYGFPVVGSTASSLQIRDLKAQNIWFPTSSIPDQQAEAVVSFLKAQGATKVALSTVQLGYAQESRRMMLAALKKGGIEVVLDREYAPGIQDMTPIVSEIKRANPDAVLSMSYQADGILYLRAAREQGLTTPIQYVLLGATAAYFKKMFGPNLDGILAMGHWSPEKSDWPGAREFADAYKQRYGDEPDYLGSTLAYMSAQVLEQAVAKVGLDKDKLREAIATSEFSTINGPVRFDGVANAVTPSMILQQQNGTTQIVWPPEVATADFEKRTGWAN